jgi:hypothetical protein
MPLITAEIMHIGIYVEKKNEEEQKKTTGGYIP